jgi:hypothetical protein
MQKPLKVGILCLENSPLKELLSIYLTKFQIPAGIEICFIQVDKRVSQSNIDRFIFRTMGIFQDMPRVSLLGFDKLLVESHVNKSSVEKIASLEMDIGLNFGTHATLNAEILDSFRFGILNCHPGNLPIYRGSCSLEWSLYNSDAIVSTLHLMDLSIDTGPIIDKTFVSPEFPFTYFEFRALIMWIAICQPISYLQKLTLSTEVERLESVSGLTQGDGKFWHPIPDDLLTQIIKGRAREKGDQLALLRSLDIDDWYSEFTEKNADV